MLRCQLTKQAAEMLSSVCSAWSVRFLSIGIGIPLRTLLGILEALKSAPKVSDCHPGIWKLHRGRVLDLPVEEDPAESPIEVLTKSSDDLLKDVHLSGALFTLGLLVL